MYCENCGTSVNAGSKFCSACGNKIEADDDSLGASQSSFTGGRRRNSSYDVQTILLISISVLLFGTVGAWLIIPSTFQSTRQSEDHSAPKLNARIGDHLSPSDSNIKSLLEVEWSKYSVNVPLGNFAVLAGPFGSPDVDASKGTISTDTYNELIAWQKLGLVTVRNDQQYENFRSGRNFS